jgi:hypothetical protein
MIPFLRRFWLFVLTAWKREPDGLSSPEPRLALVDGKAAEREVRNESPSELEAVKSRGPDEETVEILDRRSFARLLGDAPQYFDGLRLWRKICPNEIPLLSTIGCAMLPDDERLRVLAHVPKDASLPFFHAVISHGKYWDWTADENNDEKKAGGSKEDWISLHIYRRINNGAFIPWGDVYYEWMNLFANTRRNIAGGQAAFIGVKRDTGEIRVLSQQTVRRQLLPNGEALSHRSVGIPKWVSEEYREARKRGTRRDDVHGWAGALFAISLSEWRSVDKGWQVHLAKGGLVFRVCIGVASAKTFFRDRDVADGLKRRPIFHIVSAHERALANGKVAKVKEHYRGNRRFEWNGYDVCVTVPGYHHAKYSMADFDAYDPEYADMPKGRMMDQGQISRVIKRLVWSTKRSGLHSFMRGH